MNGVRKMSKQMEQLEKKLRRKDREIGTLVDKLRKMEEKQEKDELGPTQEVYELDSRVKELIEEKQETVLREEQAIHETEKMIYQIEDLQEQNKRLNEDITEIGILKAESGALNLKVDNQLKRILELEGIIKGKDETIDQLRALGDQLREEIHAKTAEFSQKGSELSGAQLDKIASTRSLDEIKENLNELKSEMNELNTTKNNQSAEIKHLYAEIEKLEKDKEKINPAIAEKDGEIAKISTEIGEAIAKNIALEENLTQYQKNLEEAEVNLIYNALPNLAKGESQVVERIADILQKVKHNATISLPKFDLLPQILNLDNLRTSTRLRIMTSVNFRNESHKAIFQQFSKSNILIRNSEEKNLWAINRDHEELLLAPQDRGGTPLGVVFQDSYQIEILEKILVDIWGKCRRDVTLPQFE